MRLLVGKESICHMAYLLRWTLLQHQKTPRGDPKKTLKPTQKREIAQFLQVGFEVGERCACQVVGSDRSGYRYKSTAEDQTALKMRIRDLAAARVRYGYRRLHVLLKREGWKINHKRVYRLYRLQGLSLRLKSRKKRVSAARVVQSPPTTPNQRWSMDFMSDSLADGRRFRILTLVDTTTRESPAIEVGRFLGKQLHVVSPSNCEVGMRGSSPRRNDEDANAQHRTDTQKSLNKPMKMYSRASFDVLRRRMLHAA